MDVWFLYAVLVLRPYYKFAMNFICVHGLLVCNSPLISVYVYLVKIFAHVECYCDCSRRGSHFVEPISTVLFNVCSVVTVECCILHPCCVDVYGTLAVM